MRRRWIQVNGELIEVPTDYRPPPRQFPAIHTDLPGYQSPVSGLWIEGRKARREDLKRTGSRPWEGQAAELKEAARQQAYLEQKQDAALSEAVERSYMSIDPERRKVLG